MKYFQPTVSLQLVCGHGLVLHTSDEYSMQC